jgi:hypothetical protein
MTKLYTRIQAQQMREAGHSYNYISQMTKVSKGTLTVWLADVPYVPNLETIERIGKARAASGQAKGRLKRESIASAKEEALVEMAEVSGRDLFMLGLGLYIGEGVKSHSSVGFANANPAVMNLIIRWLVEVLNLPKSHIRLRLHLYPDSDEAASLQYWSEMTTIPLSQFQKTSFDWRTDKKTTKAGKLPHGTAHLVVRSLGEKKFGVFLSRKIQAWSAQVLKQEDIAGVV